MKIFRNTLLVFFVFACVFPVLIFALTNHCSINKKVESVNKNDLENIEILFRKLVFEDDFGYTLFGEKPISAAGYFTEQPFGNIMWGHFERFPLRQLWQSWEKYQQQFTGDRFILLNEPDEPSGERRVITLINKQQFVSKVKEHLELFRKELGQEITGERLLERVVVKKETLFEVLHENEQLYGILLGYGKDNAAAFERRYELLKMFSLGYESSPLNFSLYFPKKREGFVSLEEEFFYWEQNTSRFNWPCKWSHIRPPNFVALKDTPETLRLHKTYRKTQRKLIDLYSKDDFLKITLRQLSS